MDTKPEQDVMSAEQILDELRKLIDSEKAEGDEQAGADSELLGEASAKLEAYVASEKREIPNAQEEMARTPESVIDTNSLTGPLPSLKNYLIKKQQANDAR